MQGLIHLYCGDGKGKTTAAVGLSVRAAGAGKRVLFAQFLKDGSSSELNVLRALQNVEVACCTQNFGFFKAMDGQTKAAALCAVRLCPNVRGYLVPSHASFEIGYRLAMEAMDLRPLFDLGMRLGEGSGCPLAFQVLDAACAVINDMATFDEAGINDDYLDEIRRGDQFTP